MRTIGREGRRADAGGVTAEFAAALPAVVLLLVGCLAGLQLVGDTVRLQDAAGIAARGAARGEDGASASARAAAAVPGARIAIGHDGDLVCATASARSAAAGALLRVRLAARSCALDGGR
ncbi:TadE family type IV pilus minor pilin [Galbitalea sp. SE-J8]|uniref:TadE family type IV pilus minor pilin n=1 Tax=Galbitalea sp. SE-J8 TaxID=3054952 RepID=UPI00259CC4A8|nr:TadE family type IV pilus minor pilin [Galbitalea sp. SE-J8]MDM4763600.1 TadE family type IV pilus minor pilin [Galbitalea sp. SE-J8]